jgi:hexosaminidase
MLTCTPGASMVKSLLLVCLVGCANATDFPRPTYQSPELTPWPKPAHATNGTGVLHVGDVVITTNSTSAILSRNIQRCINNIKDNSPSSPISDAAASGASTSAPMATATASLTVVVGSDAEELDDATDESYALHVGAGGNATVTAPSVFGALHALESFSQLFEQGAPDRAAPLQLRGLPWAIRDAPRFAHRGMLLDTARHFLPVDEILAHVDAMAAVKLNLLHWHLVRGGASSAAPGAPSRPPTTRPPPAPRHPCRWTSRPSRCSRRRRLAWARAPTARRSGECVIV